MTRNRRKALKEIIERLPDAQVEALIDYAAFLLARHGRDEPAVEPMRIDRPPQESVVVAIKRLRATYPMIDPATILHETADLMAQHVMQGREAVEVIDELEILFRRHFERVTDSTNR